MAKFILGKKLNMTQKFQEAGTAVAVTVLKAGPCTIVQVKGEKEAYNAVQIGFGTKKKISKSVKGHYKGLNIFQHLKEFRVDDSSSFERAKVFDLSSFVVGEKLFLQAVSKGKGFQGVVKRHGFKGGPASHGHKDQERMPGSIGATDAARVFKGTRMGGRMGTDTVTIPTEVIEIDVEKNLLYIKGAVPGARNSLVRLYTKEGELTYIEAPKVEAKKEEEKKPEVKEEKALKKEEEAKKEVKDKVNDEVREGDLGQEKPVVEDKKEEAPKVEAKKEEKTVAEKKDTKATKK